MKDIVSSKHSYLPRIVPIRQMAERRSVFLLGPRQTGKSALLRNVFPDTPKINLLLNEEYFRYQSDPSLLAREYRDKKPQLIIIDEIQKLPQLLNDVHFLIEESGHRFVLTGSSARSLRKNGTNLLGGRASHIAMHPFVREELKDEFSLERALSFGLMPSHYFASEPGRNLKDYVGLYLKEEIMAEGVTRNLQTFSRFLEVAASSHGQLINYTKVANDAQMPPSTTYEYFRILTDTLIGKEVPAFGETKKRKPIVTSKFYFFDLGVVRSLLGKEEIKKSDADYGIYFESFIFQELDAYTSYRGREALRYWRSKSNYEVDFIFDGNIAIEVKSTSRLVSSDLKGLRALKEERLMKKFYAVSFDQKDQEWDGIRCIHWKTFLDLLAKDQL